MCLCRCRLSKGTIGEYLGDGDKHVIEIMYEYVDSLNFKGLDFVSALRCVVAMAIVSFSRRHSRAAYPGSVRLISLVHCVDLLICTPAAACRCYGNQSDKRSPLL